MIKAGQIWETSRRKSRFHILYADDRTILYEHTGTGFRWCYSPIQFAKKGYIFVSS